MSRCGRAGGNVIRLPVGRGTPRFSEPRLNSGLNAKISNREDGQIAVAWRQSLPRALQPVHDATYRNDFSARALDLADGLHHGGALREDIVDDRNAEAWPNDAFDALLAAVRLGLLAHEESFQLPALFVIAKRRGRRHRNG